MMTTLMTFRNMQWLAYPFTCASHAKILIMVVRETAVSKKNKVLSKRKTLYVVHAWQREQAWVSVSAKSMEKIPSSSNADSAAR